MCHILPPPPDSFFTTPQEEGVHCPSAAQNAAGQIARPPLLFRALSNPRHHVIKVNGVRGVQQKKESCWLAGWLLDCTGPLPQWGLSALRKALPCAPAPPRPLPYSPKFSGNQSKEEGLNRGAYPDLPPPYPKRWIRVGYDHSPFFLTPNFRDSSVLTKNQFRCFALTI